MKRTAIYTQLLSRVREPRRFIQVLAGPRQVGKTTLAQIVARELGVGFRATSGPVIARAGDLAAIQRGVANEFRTRSGEFRL